MLLIFLFTTLQFFPEAEATENAICGTPAISPNIENVGRIMAVPNSWPWIASFQMEGSDYLYHYSSASIISPDFLVSTAESRFRVGDIFYLGTNDVYVYTLNNCQDPERCVKVEAIEVWVHENFTDDRNNRHDPNNIAIVRFSPSISQFTDKISPVCLPEPGDEDRLPVKPLCYEIGFQGPDLYQVGVELINQSLCSHSDHDPAAICARSDNENSYCSDEGGPIVCQVPGEERWKLFGISTFGYIYGCHDSPRLYTPVEKHINWIKSILDTVNPICETPAISPNISEDVRRIMAVPYSWPWMVSGYYGGGTVRRSNHASGSIISPGFLVSTAQYRFLYRETLFLGANDLNNCREESESCVKVEAIETWVHENYTRFPSYLNNIQVVKYSHPRITDKISPVCLPEPGDEDRLPENPNCYEVGFDGPRLYQVRVEWINQSACNRNNYDPDLMICGTTAEENSYCSGHGGSLVCQVPGEERWKLFGISTYDSRCRTGTRHLLYTRVEKYMSWIKNILDPEEED